LRAARGILSGIGQGNLPITPFDRSKLWGSGVFTLPGLNSGATLASDPDVRN
jgi:hypothetical protein